MTFSKAIITTEVIEAPKYKAGNTPVNNCNTYNIDKACFAY
jgi:hypothetical protein